MVESSLFLCSIVCLLLGCQSDLLQALPFPLIEPQALRLKSLVAEDGRAHTK
jgi:hypothetical protein